MNIAEMRDLVFLRKNIKPQFELFMPLLYLKFIITFLVGAFWITFITVLAERFGSRIGGFIAGTPSTILVTFFFIGLIQSPQIAAGATTITPAVMGVNSLFLALFVLFSQWGFWRGFLGAFSVWFLLSALMVWFGVAHVVTAILWCVFLTIVGYVILKKLNVPPSGRVSVHYSPLALLFRAGFGGSMIALGVVMSYFVNPIFGGLFAAFPAVYISSIFILYYSSGLQFVRAIGMPLYISAAVGVLTYTLGVRYLYPAFGIGWGTFGAYVIAVGMIFLLYWRSE